MTPRTRIIIMVLVIFSISLSLRLPFLSVPALNGDEGDNFDTVKQFLEKGISPWERMVFTPPPYYWVVSFVAYFFGLNEFTLRSVSLFFGTLTPVLFFFGAQYIFRDERKAFVAGLISAVLPFFALYSRDAHIEAMQVFIVILAVWVIEFFLNHQRSRSWLFVSIILTWLSVSVKYNAVVPFGLYWLFKIISSRKEWKRTLKYAVIINLLVFVLLIVLTGFVHIRLAYFAYGILSWSINQSADANVPWYYYISVLFEGLSPLIFVLFVVGFLFWLYLSYQRRLSEKEQLVLFLCVFMLIIVFIQGRKYPRHLMLVIPWIVLLVGDIFFRMFVWFKKQHYLLAGIFLLFVILSTGLWSVNKISLYNQHTVWKDVGTYLLDNAPNNSTVFIDGGDYWPLVIHTDYSLKITSSLRADLLKENDIVIVYDVDMKKPFFIGSPFQNDLFFYHHSYALQYPLNPEYVQKTAGHQPSAKSFYDYVVSHGIIIKEFAYGSGNKVKVVKMTRIVKPPLSDWRPPLNNIGKMMCNFFNQSALSKQLLKSFSQRLSEELYNKCTRGCVHTCSLF